jgi:hypothetical protein
VLRVLLGLGSGAAECISANLVPALGQERIEAGLLSLLDSPFSTVLKATLAEGVNPVCV